MTRALLVLIAMLSLPLYATAESAEDAVQDSDEPAQIMNVSEAPEEAVEAAREAAPDVYFETVHAFWDEDEHVHLFKGRLFNEEVAVYVTAQGRVLQVNRGLADD